MTNKSLIILLILLMSSYFGMSSDNDTNEKLTSHLIVAFDDALPENFRNLLLSNQLLKDSLCQNEYVSGSILKMVEKHGLLHEGDYYSVVNFCIGTENKQWDDFVKPSKLSSFYEGEGWAAWQQYSKSKKLFPSNQSDWQNVVCYQGENRTQGAPYSLLTGAKPFALESMKSDGKRTNRVFLILVTDDHYNGNDDVNKEINRFYNRYLPKDSFINSCRKVNEYYRFEFVDEVEMLRSYEEAYKVILFEVVPCFSVSLNSVIDYPASFGLHRVKGGYEVCFDYQGIDSMFHIEKLVITVKQNNEVISSKINGRGDGGFHLELDGVYPYDSVSVEMSCWLSMEDPVYNGVLMSPDDERFTRLNISRKIMLTDQARVFGQPLKEGFWWFSHNDSSKAALIWEVIIVVTGIVLVILFFFLLIKFTSKYVPNDKDIRLDNFNPKN